MTPSPVFPQGPNDTAPYQYVEWPQWLFHPETGKGQVFQSQEEVPEGWLTAAQRDALKTLEEANVGLSEEQQALLDAQRQTEGDGSENEGGEGEGTGDTTNQTGSQEPHGAEMPRELTAEDRKALIDTLSSTISQKDLAAELDLMNEARAEAGEDEIEFAPNWPKKKLAETMVDNGYRPDETE